MKHTHTHTQAKSTECIMKLLVGQFSTGAFKILDSKMAHFFRA